MARLKEIYQNEIVDAMMKKFGYKNIMEVPKLEKIQTILTTDGDEVSQLTAACALRFSSDEKHVFCSNAGDNSITVYNRDQETGLLDMLCSLPVSGEYPKDASLFPNNKFLVSLNHESNTMTFFHVDVEKGTMIMNGPPIHVDVPNCITFHKL